MTEIDTYEKVNYVAIEPLTWYEYFFGKSEPEIEADPQSKDAKYKVTQQIKNSINHKLVQKHQDDTPFPHTQSLVKTEDISNALPSPYQPPTLVPATILSTMQTKPQVPSKKLHPSIQQLRKRKKLIKDDMDI
tara:strand:+ start:415 stop:813 length:399 start_codon:yes stop_codon:yes gene_type:complete